MPPRKACQSSWPQGGRQRKNSTDGPGFSPRPPCSSLLPSRNYERPCKEFFAKASNRPRSPKLMSHNLKPNKSWPSLPLVIVQLLLPAVVVAQDMKPAAATVHESAEAIVPPTALTISFHGTCDYSEDGVTFSKLERAHIFAQGATVRTGDDGRVDLFF